MTLQDRLNHILRSLAQLYAPHLLEKDRSEMSQGERLKELMRALAQAGVLVLIGEIAPQNKANKDTIIYLWVKAYADLYELLTKRLFSSLQNYETQYADQGDPPITFLRGDCSVVISVMAGYAVPYAAIRVHERMISEAELIGVMTMMLKDLAADDLERAEYDQLVNQGAAILRRLLQIQISQVWLNDFDRSIFSQRPDQTPLHEPKPLEKKSPPPMPETLPETNQMPRITPEEEARAKAEAKAQAADNGDTETEPLAQPPEFGDEAAKRTTSTMPIFFRRKGNKQKPSSPKRGRRSRPPVPRVNHKPSDDDDDEAD